MKWSFVYREYVTTVPSHPFSGKEISWMPSVKHRHSDPDANAEGEESRDCSKVLVTLGAGT